jgi:hypothetical protein
MEAASGTDAMKPKGPEKSKKHKDSNLATSAKNCSGATTFGDVIQITELQLKCEHIEVG